MIRRFTNGWVISFLVLAAVSFGLTYGILALLQSDNGVESVAPTDSQVGVVTDTEVQLPPPPTDGPTAAAEPESPAGTELESKVDRILDSPEAELAVGDAIETIVTTAEGEEIATNSPPIDQPSSPSGPGDAAGVGSVVEFSITRGGQ